MEKKRLDYFDMARGVGICLVVLGHISYISDSLRIFIFSFHMPLFFLISGMLIRYRGEEERELGTLVKKKAAGLLIPYGAFSAISLIIDAALLMTGRHGSLDSLWESLYSTVSLYGISTLWFLPALFVGEMVFLFFIKKFSLARAFLIMLCLTAVCCLGITNTYRLALLPVNQVAVYYIQFPLFVVYKGVIAMSYIALGYLAFLLLERLHPGDSRGTRFAGLAAGVILLTADILLAPYNGNADLGHLLLNNIGLYYLCGLLGSLGVILICRALKPIRLFTYFGRNSIIIMASHLNLYVSYLAIRIIFFMGPRMEAFHTALAAALFVLTMVLECGLIWVINRYFPFLLGRKRLRAHKAGGQTE